MLNKMTRIFIGKDIDREATLVAGDSLATVLQAIQEGEVVVTDKNKNLLLSTTPPTYAEGTATDALYIIEGLAEQSTISDPAGTSITVRKVNTSDPIEGKLVTVYEGEPFTAKAEQVDTFDLTGLTPNVGTEYFIRFIYKDMQEHPGQFTATYRAIAETTSSDDLANALVKRIMDHKGRRVNASYASPVITITGRPRPECTSSLGDIDKFKMVEFESRFDYVDSDGNWQKFADLTSHTPAVYGSGNWEQVRDAEKVELGYLGITNQTVFPVIKPDFRTVKNAAYDTIVIEHGKSYYAPNNQGNEVANLRTVIYLGVDPATGNPVNNQAADVVGILNAWMASLPQGFANVTI